MLIKAKLSDKLIMRVILDTSVIVSALLSRSPNHTKNILEMAQKPLIELVSSYDSIAELKNTFSDTTIKKHPNYNSNKLGRFLAWYIYNTKQFSPDIKLDICRDSKDNKFLELAVISRAEFIISNDLDLLVLKTFQGIQIVKPVDFITLFNEIT